MTVNDWLPPTILGVTLAVSINIIERKDTLRAFIAALLLGVGIVYYVTARI